MIADIQSQLRAVLKNRKISGLEKRVLYKTDATLNLRTLAKIAHRLGVRVSIRLTP